MLTDAEVGEHRGADVTRLVDEVGGAAHSESERPLHVVHTDDELVDVREQDERQLVLFAESAVTLGPLRAHARDTEARLLDLGMQVADGARLAGAARSEVGGIEVQDQRPVAQQRAERHALPVLVRKCELRRSEEHTSELQSLTNLVCRLLLEKKKKKQKNNKQNNNKQPTHNKPSRSLIKIRNMPGTALKRTPGTHQTIRPHTGTHTKPDQPPS